MRSLDIPHESRRMNRLGAESRAETRRRGDMSNNSASRHLHPLNRRLAAGAGFTGSITKACPGPDLRVSRSPRHAPWNHCLGGLVF